MYPDLFERNVNGFTVSVVDTAAGSPGPCALDSNFDDSPFHPAAVAPAGSGKLHGAVKPGFVAVLWRNRPCAKIVIRDFAGACRAARWRGAAGTLGLIAVNAAAVDSNGNDVGGRHRGFGSRGW
jgi:hypothetical protein